MTHPDQPEKPDDFADPAITSGSFVSNSEKQKEIDTLQDVFATNSENGFTNPKVTEASKVIEVLLGRFRVLKILGEGAFGKVYLARDEHLNRLVAIKISKEIIHDKNLLDSFLNEAQMLAKLDHPNIVPIHDVGNSESEGFFIISKYLDGGSLSQAINKNAKDISWVCKTIAMIADGLHHAHSRGLVHRDIKPDNILLDTSGNPCIVDFGLALKEESFGEGRGLMGTLLYMSPEQASGEGHRVDGRSDIFSLGVIFYETLAGRRPFEAKTVPMLLQMIKLVEVKPPRQVNQHIPKELERICLKALSRKLLDRYSTAADMAEDLRTFMASAAVVSSGGVLPFASLEVDKVGSKSSKSSGVESKSIPLIYKGLRSFDQSDADFFLELLPGSRDREGLPNIIRFWKTQIENPSSSFTVGVIYGPSGCGKSSLMKAGLIPNLDGKIIPIYLEATATDTEESILKKLYKRFPDLPQDLSLPEVFGLIRRKKPAGLNNKLLIIVDQFEQWLHANPKLENAPLVQALRQVDGDYIQVFLMIRDDFMLAMNRLMAALEIPILEGTNFTLIDLFDQKHASKVLRLFGQALECLPKGDISKEQQQFINDSINALSIDGKVVSVRLSVFADMMKSRPWLLSSLKSLGGVEGVGVLFLEETFFSSSAPVLCKIHHNAAQKVLRALLPSVGSSSIKGCMLSLEALKEVSTYGDKPRDFEQLLQLLDSELRLITPTSLEEEDTNSNRFYQLSHDYLVPSLQEWLLRKQKETRKGQAELVLEDRAQVWNLHPENRQLPSLFQWLNIGWHTRSRDWTKLQRRMMKKARHYYLLRSMLITLVVVVLGGLGLDGYGRVKSEDLVERLLDANSADVPAIVKEISGYRRWANPILLKANNKAEQEKDERKQLHTSLALLPIDNNQIDYIYARLLVAKPNEVDVIVNSLKSYKEELKEKLWDILLNPAKGNELQILRAGSALAVFDPQSKNWEQSCQLIVSQLVKENLAFIRVWADALRPVKNVLINPLSKIFNNRALDKATENSLATNLLGDFASDLPEILVSLILDADEKQFALLFPVLKEHSAACLLLLSAEINKNIPPKADDKFKETFAKKQANAALALANLNQPETLWPLLIHSQDLRRRSFLIDKLAMWNVDHTLILKRLNLENDNSIRRALIQSLGEFGLEQISIDERKTIIPLLQEIYLKDNDSGVHASAEWLLKSWGEETFLNKTNEIWKNDKDLSAKRQIEIRTRLTKEKEKSVSQWYVNGQGQTMVVIPGPIEFLMGSPEGEADRNIIERQHNRRISRSFEMSSNLITINQYQQFDKSYINTLDAKYARRGDLPAIKITWFMASGYCNWLSQQEGIPKDQWCYEMDVKGNVTALKKDYLSLKGYRLPTEAEMEYASRAGSITARYFGETDELLSKYAWNNRNSQNQTWPVGILKPNDFGLFDMLGNCFNWCMDIYKSYPELDGVAVEDKENELTISAVDLFLVLKFLDRKNGSPLENIGRVLRGGSFVSHESLARSALRGYNIPFVPLEFVGFRLAKTN